MKEVKGNLVEMLLNGELDVIIHGCNYQTTMGAGIALEIKKKIPEAYWADVMYSQNLDYNKLSNWSIASVRNRLGKVGFVINLYTQYNGGSDLYEHALLLGFQKLKHFILTDKKIGIPFIGCGIAGGDWDKLKPQIVEIMKNHKLTIVEFDNKK